MNLLFAVTVRLHLVVTIIHLARTMHADTTAEFAVCISLMALPVAGVESVCHIASLKSALHNQQGF